jgi:uncharacterized protein (DUF488 family)
MLENDTQPTYRRQRFLLAFIRQLKEGVTSLEIQKLIFLYTMQEKSDFYEFIPYKFGAYSFQLAEDVGILTRDGYVAFEEPRIRAIGNYQIASAFPIAPERSKALIRKAYREYPYYTINSEIIHEHFEGEEAKRLSRGREQYRQAEQKLFTIGYEGKGIEAFGNLLISNDVHMLCDVRKNPLSRKFGFSKGKLEHIMKTIGIKYCHLPELGIESDKRKSLNTVEDYQRLFREYADTLPRLIPHIEHLHSLLTANNRIALMCYEKEPQMCHRHVIRDYLASTFSIGYADL